MECLDVVFGSNANEMFLPAKLIVMERDARLTGDKRGQSTNPTAPKGFEVTNAWKVRVLLGLVHAMG